MFCVKLNGIDFFSRYTIQGYRSVTCFMVPVQHNLLSWIQAQDVVLATSRIWLQQISINCENTCTVLKIDINLRRILLTSSVMRSIENKLRLRYWQILYLIKPNNSLFCIHWRTIKSLYSIDIEMHCWKSYAKNKIKFVQIM